MSYLPKKENLQIEFKSDLKELPDKELIDVVVALSNTEGGEIYLGIEDNGIVTGVSQKHKDPIGVRAMIMNKTIPSAGITAEVLDLENKEVLKISVPKNSMITATSDGRILKRRLKIDGTPENVPIYPYELNTRLTDLVQQDYSYQVVPGATLADLNPNERIRLKQLIRQNNGEQYLLDLKDTELDQALGLIKREGDKLKPTVTGILLLGYENRIKELIPTNKNMFQILNGTKVRINKEYSKPLLETFEILLNFFRTQNLEDELDLGLSRVAIPAYSEQAFREALINAFSHRDYSILQANRIALDDYGLTITSPGSFLSDINFKNLITTEPQSRNPNLADALKRIGLAEKTGRGIDRIYEGSLRFGKNLPDYSESGSRFVKVFIPRGNPDYFFTEFISKNSDKYISIIELFILYYLYQNPGNSAKKIIKEYGFPKVRVELALETLLSNGLIKVSGKNGRARYELVDQPNRLDLNTEQIAETDVLEFIKDNNGVTTRKDIVAKFNISKDKAYRILKKLVDKKKLKITGSGRGTKYLLA